MGRGYVIDYCVSSFKKQQEDKSFRVYVTDMLKECYKAIIYLRGGSGDVPRFYDMVYKKPIEETRTADEVVDDIKSRLMKMGK